MRTINTIILIFTIFAIFYTIREFRRDRKATRSTILWLSIWICVGVFGVFPQLLDLIMHATMMTNRMYFLFVISILILYALLFQKDSQITFLSRRIDRLTQEIGILNYRLDNKQSHSKKGTSGR